MNKTPACDNSGKEWFAFSITARKAWQLTSPPQKHVTLSQAGTVCRPGSGCGWPSKTGPSDLPLLLSFIVSNKSQDLLGVTDQNMREGKRGVEDMSDAKQPKRRKKRLLRVLR